MQDQNKFDDTQNDNIDIDGEELGAAPEPENDDRDERARRSRRRLRQLLGVAIAILVVVGAVSIVRGGVDLASSLVNDTSEYEEYRVRISSFVWFDVLPFDAPENASQTTLKQAVIWGVMNQMGADNVPKNERGEPQVAAIEMDRYAAALFGPGFALEHSSFSDPVQGLSYEYDPATEIYTAPATGISPMYMPTVVDIVREPGGVRRVVVGYVSAIGSNEELVSGLDYDHPSKYMDYYFLRDGNEYYLYAIQANDTYVPDTPAASSSLPASSAPASSLPDSSLPPDSSSAPPPASESAPADSAADGGEGAETVPDDGTGEGGEEG